VNKTPKQKSAIDLIRSYHGSSSVFGGNEEVNFNVKATSTGSLNLDDAISCGGIPDGRLILWSGPESSGKTLGSLCYAKKKQAEGKRVLFIDAEYTWDHSWVTKLGIRTDPEYMMVMQESSGTKIFETLCGKPANKKRQSSIPGILSKEILDAMKEEGTPLGAIIVDSINTVIPPIEEDMETGAQQIGSLSRFLPPVLRRLAPLLGEFQIPCIFICQARTNIAQMHGDPLTVSGGKALMHGASVWIDSRKINGSEIYRPEDTEQIEPIGHQIRLKIRKNKVGPPSRKAEVTIYYERGIDLRPELLDQGLLRGVIKKEGNSLYYSGFPGGKIVGNNNAMTALFQDKALQLKLLNDILAHKANQAREVKKEGQEFVTEEQEEVVAAEAGIKTRLVEETGKAKILKSTEAEAQKIITVNGQRVDVETGEVLGSVVATPSINDDEFTPVSEEEPKADAETTILSVDDSDTPAAPAAATKAAAAPAVAVPSLADITPETIHLISLSTLKKQVRDKKMPNWYKASKEEMIRFLEPSAKV